MHNKKIIVNLKRLYEQNKRENGINLNINSFFKKNIYIKKAFILFKK
jgi:hypothetical protein